jgi:two-component system sensor histidine kinase KdpD
MVAFVTVSMLTSALTTRMKRQEHARAEAEKEKLRGDLLRAISHDLRTPLTSIIGANAALTEGGELLTNEQKAELHRNIEQEAQWLRRMIENLLSITRISGDSCTKISKTPEAVEEVVAAAAEKARTRFPQLPVYVRVPEEILICPMDAMLIEQLLLNLLQNVAQHAAGATFAQINVSKEKQRVKISVLDDGCGIKKERFNLYRRNRTELWNVFGDSARTSGIGLSVCMAIAAAHGGSLLLENRTAGGFAASLFLPVED